MEGSVLERNHSTSTYKAITGIAKTYINIHFFKRINIIRMHFFVRKDRPLCHLFYTLAELHNICALLQVDGKNSNNHA